MATTSDTATTPPAPPKPAAAPAATKPAPAPAAKPARNAGAADPDEATDTHPRWLLKAIGVLAAIVVALAIARVAGPSATTSGAVSEPGTEFSYYDVRGFVTIAGPKGVLVSTSSTVEGTGDPVCWGQSQYRDIGYGVTVTIYNDADQIVAYGALDVGRATTIGSGSAAVPACAFPMLVHDVPTGSGFYQVQIAQRGTVMVPNEPEDGVLYAFLGLDEAPDALPEIADQPPKLPQNGS